MIRYIVLFVILKFAVEWVDCNCKHCDKNYKVAKDGSTFSLWKHIKTKHNELFLEINQITDALNKLEISESLIYILF